MLTKQKGFTALETILILVLIGVIGFVGWTVYQSNQEDEQPEEPAASEQVEEEPNETASFLPGELLELNPPVRLSTTQDVENLPEQTPTSFKDYMRGVLSDFDTTFEAPASDVECEQYIEVNLISTINAGAQFRAEEAGTNQAGQCAIGGGQMIYYLADEQTEQWDNLGIAHAPPTCEQLVEKEIYEEFIDTCLENAGDSPSNAVSNPNGSISKLRQD